MAYVLVMPARQLRNPMVFIIFVIPRNRLFHARALPFQADQE